MTRAPCLCLRTRLELLTGGPAALPSLREGPGIDPPLQCSMARIEASIEDFSTRVATLPRSLWRRHGDTSLATLSGGIRMAVLTSPFIVRWAAWAVAVLIIAISDVPHYTQRFEPWLLLATMAQTAFVTFYVPAIRPVVLPILRRRIAAPENSDVLAL